MCTPRFLASCLILLAAATSIPDLKAIEVSDRQILVHRDDLSAEDRAKVSAVTKDADQFSKPEPFELMSAGAATSRKKLDRDAFSHASANITFDEETDFRLGNSLFEKLWASSPSSTLASDGLGPLYNARSCHGCHIRDGRGRPPLPDEEAVSLFLRVSVPPRTDDERQMLADKQMLVIPEPTYGKQIQNFAVVGLSGEARFDIETQDIPVTLNGGETVILKKPTYHLRDLAYGDMDPEVMISPRVAPPMIGLGLLEAIHPGDIEANADPDDQDGNGISGKISWVRDPKTDTLAIGRFGWKASTPDVRTQAASAFSGDVGISTPDFPANWGDCTENQKSCREWQHGEQLHLGVSEAPDPIMGLVTFYSENLAVPARRNVDKTDVLRGKEVFYTVGCASCHRPKYVTSRNAANKAHRFQLIWPYTDLLLHDMGPDLADGRPVGDASGNEWKTPPLWGIGLTQTVNGHTRFLHDGRARNLLEAVLWHGGEAEPAKQAVIDLPPEDRNALIRFLESL